MASQPAPWSEDQIVVNTYPKLNENNKIHFLFVFKLWGFKFHSSINPRKIQ
jgi:hypothetical protein